MRSSTALSEPTTPYKPHAIHQYDQAPNTPAAAAANGGTGTESSVGIGIKVYGKASEPYIFSTGDYNMAGTVSDQRTVTILTNENANLTLNSGGGWDDQRQQIRRGQLDRDHRL